MANRVWKEVQPKVKLGQVKSGQVHIIYFAIEAVV